MTDATKINETADLMGKLNPDTRLRNKLGAELIVIGLHMPNPRGGITSPLGTIYEVEHPAEGRIFPPVARLATREGLEQAGYDVIEEPTPIDPADPDHLHDRAVADEQGAW